MRPVSLNSRVQNRGNVGAANFIKVMGRGGLMDIFTRLVVLVTKASIVKRCLSYSAYRTAAECLLLYEKGRNQVLGEH